MKNLLTIGLALLFTSFTLHAQDSNLWTAGNSTAVTYNADNYYDQYETSSPYTHQAGVFEREEAVFQLYPIPASSYITISDMPAGAYLSIIDVSGKQVRAERADHPVLTLHTHELPDGLYMLRVETAQGQVSTRQFMIQR